MTEKAGPDRSPRRRWGVILPFALFIGLKAAFKPFPDSPLGSDVSGTCLFVDVRQGERIGAQDVLVSVFNASGEAGLARNTIRQLSERGFGSGNEGNEQCGFCDGGSD